MVLSACPPEKKFLMYINARLASLGLLCSSLLIGACSSPESITSAVTPDTASLSLLAEEPDNTAGIVGGETEAVPESLFDFDANPTLLGGRPTVFGVQFPSVVPGNGSFNAGSFLWIDTGADITQVELEFTRCPAPFGCSGGSIPINSNRRIGRTGFGVSCNNSTGSTATFEIGLTPIDISGQQGRESRFSYQCTSI